MSLKFARPTALFCCLALLASLFAVAGAASAAELGEPLPPVLIVDGGELRWTQPDNGVDIGGHNVHRGDGSYVTTVNGTDRWDPAGVAGEYFLTAFDQTPGGAQISDRSNTVEIPTSTTVTDPGPVDLDPLDPGLNDPDPVSDGPALPDGFVCGNWPPVPSSADRDPVTLDAQDEVLAQCGRVYDSQNRDRCDWMNDPAGWRCMIFDASGESNDPVDPGPGDGDRDTTIAPPRPTDVRIREGNLEWRMPGGPSFVYQVTTNNSKIDDGQPWTQREVQNDAALTVTEVDGGGKHFSFPVDGFTVGTTFRVESIHPWDIDVTGPRAAASRYATVPATNGGATIPDFLGTFDASGTSSIGGDWIGDRSEWNSTPQFVDEFDGTTLSSQWYNAPDDLTPARTRDQLHDRDHAQVRDGRLEMTVDQNTGEYSYLGTGNDAGDGYQIDASNGTFVEASIRLDQAAPADNAWWGFWLMTSGKNAQGADNAYDGDAATGSEVDLFEFVPDQNNGFNSAVYRSQPSGDCGSSDHLDAVRTPEEGDCFSYDSPDDIAGVAVPDYMDGNYHRIGMYYGHDRYAFYIDNTLIWEVIDPAFITQDENLAIRLTWELQNQNNPWSPSLGGATTDSARDDDPTVYVDWVKVWEKSNAAQPTDPPVGSVNPDPGCMSAAVGEAARRVSGARSPRAGDLML